MYSVPVTARARNAPFVQPLHQRPNCPEYTAREAALGYSRSRGFPELQAKRRSRVNIRRCRTESSAGASAHLRIMPKTSDDVCSHCNADVTKVPSCPSRESPSLRSLLWHSVGGIWRCLVPQALSVGYAKGTNTSGSSGCEAASVR